MNIIIELIGLVSSPMVRFLLRFVLFTLRYFIQIALKM